MSREMLMVTQAGRRACSALQRTLVHLARSALTPAHGNLCDLEGMVAGQYNPSRAGAPQWPDRRHWYHNAAVHEVGVEHFDPFSSQNFW